MDDAATQTAESTLARLKQAVLSSGFSTLLNAEPLRCWSGESELVIALGPQLTQHHGVVHGAVIGAAADNARAAALGGCKRRGRRRNGDSYAAPRRAGERRTSAR